MPTLHTLHVPLEPHAPPPLLKLFMTQQPIVASGIRRAIIIPLKVQVQVQVGRALLESTIPSEHDIILATMIQPSTCVVQRARSF